MTSLAQTLATATLAAAQPGAVPPSTYNVLPRDPAPLPGPLMRPIVNGALVNGVGGRRTGGQRPTLSVFLGPGATAHGLAYWITQRLWPAGLPAPSVEDRLQIARGLWAWNEAYLTWHGTEPWRAGLWFPLPVELAMAGDSWVTDWESIRLLGLAHPEIPGTTLELPAEPLRLPDPNLLRQAVAAWRGGLSLDDMAALLEKRVVGNPFEVVFRIVEVLRQVETASPADAATLAVKVTARLAAWELDMLAGVTSGHALLRRLFTLASRAGGEPATAAVAALGTALGLTRTEAGAWQPPELVGPRVVPVDLPLPPVAATAPPAAVNPTDAAAQEKTGGIRYMIHGRDLSLGVQTSEETKTWHGPANGGRLDPAAFIVDNEAAIGLTSDHERARLRVVRLIAPKEGMLDASRSADVGLLSTGIQQWSAHVNEELSVLLARYRNAAPDLYDLYFGMWGLQVELWWKVGGAEAAAETPDPVKVRAANPEAFHADGTPKAGKDFAPQYATLFEVPPGQPRRRLPAPTGAQTAVKPRQAFFGATKVGNKYHIAPHWCARVRLASVCSTEYRVTQIWTGIWRFERLARQPLGESTLKVRGRQFRIRDFVSSEFLAAVALDQHINKPAKVPLAIDAAITRTERAIARLDAATQNELRPFDPGPATPLRPAWLRLFQLNYLIERVIYDKPIRDHYLLLLQDKFKNDTELIGLDGAPGSFHGWVGE
ncbi:hypothetical protein ACFY2R_23745 [Micromonospora olivasterospora]|uniref:Uncharacterized protein n=1 Tax=Micromonospora olivasterospora TaxID=1880 RepID=A0A562IFY8_MICOL|nr:hypothetical protein [Micromonospora olivasterospora]TWH69929.1 hypothetical protein JD77_04946 [Micromonospora olivasterospora]